MNVYYFYVLVYFCNIYGIIFISFNDVRNGCFVVIVYNVVVVVYGVLVLVVVDVVVVVVIYFIVGDFSVIVLVVVLEIRVVYINVIVENGYYNCIIGECSIVCCDILCFYCINISIDCIVCLIGVVVLLLFVEMKIIWYVL